MTNRQDEFAAIREFYDKEYFSGSLTGSARLPWHARVVGERLGNFAARQVLDVACGTGEWLDFFSRQGAEVAGIDLSRKAIDVCRQRFPGREFVCGPAETLPFESGRFDLVTCMGSLEHFLDKPRALAEMKRVAKADAAFLILVPNAGFLTRRLGLYRGTLQTKVKEDVLDLETWTRLLQGAGLQVQARWRDLHPLSWSWITHGNMLAWPIRAAQALALAMWPLRWQYQVYHYCRSKHE
jgi:SAM-dependent methyltransferase